MQRRKFVVGLGSLAAGGAAVTGSGALTQFRGDRNITGEIVGDKKAYLKMNGAGSANNNDFVVEYNSDGEIRLNFGDNGVTSGLGGQGVNPDADNWFDDAFRLKNAGPEDIAVWLESQSDRIVFYRGKSPGSRTSLMGQGNSFDLDSGNAVAVGIYLDTNGLGKGDESTLFDGDDDFSVNANPQ